MRSRSSRGRENQGRRQQSRVERAGNDQSGGTTRRLGARAGAIIVVDAAQAAPHHAIDVQHLDCDFLAFSCHKMCGPTSVGALWGRAELLEQMAPFLLGGHMIRSVYDETTWGLPHKFEAGTQPIAEAVGFGAAIDYVSEVGIGAIEQHEHGLPPTRSSLSLRCLAVGQRTPPDRRAGIIPFNIEGIHPHDVAQVLDMEASRSARATTAASPDVQAGRRSDESRELLPLHDPGEIDRLVAGLHKAHKLLT